MAKIQLNGKKVSIGKDLTIFGLLKKYTLINKNLAIECNGEIIQKSNYKKKCLKNKDKIEIVHFIGGG